MHTNPRIGWNLFCPRPGPAILAATCLLASPWILSQAHAYDVSADFSRASNPNGVWTYGYASTLGGALTLFSHSGAGPSDNGVQVEYYDAGLKAVYRNPSATAATCCSGQGLFPPGTVWFHPASTFTVIRFTTPTGQSGTFQLESSVRAYLDGNLSGDTDYHVLHNGVELFGQQVPANSGTGYTNQLALGSGETIDFVVGPGLNSSDAAGLKINATLTLVSTNPVGPVILVQPQGRPVTAGSNVTFTVTAAGSAPLTYQWRFNNADIAGANASSYTVTNAQSTDAGNYSVLVSNTADSVVSTNAVLTVNPAPPSATFDLARDFSHAANPNGVWSYGYRSSLGGALTLFSHSGVGPTENGVPVEYWDSGLNSIFHNHSANTSTCCSGQGQFPPGTVWFHPASIFTVVRLTVPAGQSGTYQLASAVHAYLDGNLSGDTDFHVLKNGVELFGQQVPANSGTGYTNQLALGSGDTIDFVVGPGLNLGDAAGLKINATLTLDSSNPPPQQPTFDVSRDFSADSNPTGVWSYGYKTNIAGTFGLLPFFQISFGNNSVPVQSWSLTQSTFPAVYHNGTTNTATAAGPQTFPPGTVWFFPGQDGAPQNYGAIRFITPANGAGRYRLETAVRSYIDGPGAGDTDFHVVRNGVELFGQFVPSDSGTGYTNDSLTLLSGDIVDFLVGRGTDGSLNASGLKIKAMLTRLSTNPPPSQATFDLAQDFARVSNPNGVWSYGFRTELGGPLTLFSHSGAGPTDNGVPVEFWDSGLNSVFHNHSPNTSTCCNGQGQFPPGTVWFHPASSFTVIRFTVPVGQSGTYHLASAVHAYLDGNLSGDTDFHVLHNGVELFGQQVPANSGTGYTNQLGLGSGETIDFVVGPGLNLSDAAGLKINATLTLVSSNPAPAQPTYDVSRDYSTNSNPAGVWSYGYKTNINGAFGLLPSFQISFGNNSVPVQSWSLTQSTFPAVYHNGTTNTATAAGPQTFPPGTVWFFPGQNGAPQNYGAIRFITPANGAGEYSLETAVRSYIDGPQAGDTDFHVVRNGLELFGQFVPSDADTGYTNNTLTLLSGDIVDFLVGRGADGSLNASGLKIKATLTRLSTNPEPPTIVSQPLSLTVIAGSNATFMVTAAGTAPLSYQWLFNGSAIAGANGSSYTLNNAQPGNAGSYSVLVSNEVDTVISATATLTVNPSPPTATFDLARDFSRASNPNGVWTYGYASTLGGALTLFTVSGVGSSDSGVPVEYWAAGLHAVYHNPNAGTATCCSGQGQFPHGVVWFHPSSTYSLIRCTIPVGQGGAYHLESAVRAYLDGSQSGDTDYHVLKNGVELFGHQVPANSGTGYSNELALTSGDTIDFVVGPGLNLSDPAGLKINATLTLVSTNPAPAQPTYDVSRDYSTNSNPAGVWSYGYKTNINGAFGLLPFFQISFGNNSVPVQSWSLTQSTFPAVYHNGTTNTATAAGPQTFPPGTVWFFPGQDGAPQNYGAIRFITPANGAGQYRLESAVRSYIDGPGAGDTDFHVVRNGVELFGQFVPSDSSTGYTNDSLALLSGDIVDFLVGRGADGSLNASGLKIKATLNRLSTNSEPPTIPAVPVILSFSPASGPSGTGVSITGSNFDATASNNIVYFGAVRADVTSASTTSLTVTAPVGATYVPITVTVGGLTASANIPFVVTFSSGQVIDSGSFAPKVDFPADLNSLQVAIGDLDGDGKPDLVAANYSSDTISVYRNTSSSGSLDAGSFGPKVDFPTGSTPFYVAIGDVDGDGRPDLVVANRSGASVSVYRNTASNGTINSNSFAPRVSFTVGGGPSHLALRDLDGDGKPDLATANYDSSTVSILRNVSTPGVINASSFEPRIDLPAGANTQSIAVGDLDGDGRPDLAVVNYNGGNLSVFRNVSLPGSLTRNSFANRVDFGTGGNPICTVLADLDGDGRLDVVVANSGGDTVSVLRNTSAPGTINPGSFAPRVDFVSGTSPQSVAVGDLDGDGRPDLSVANFYGNTVSVLRNTGSPGSITPGSFAPRVEYASPGNPRGVAVGDLDGDGRPDLAIANFNTASVSVRRNIVAVGLPVILSQPQSQSVIVGAAASFSVVASGAGILTYQWRYNDANIEGATNASLQLTNVQMSQSGNYSVAISNQLGFAISSNAVLTVSFPPAQIQVISVAASSAGTAVVPIELRANGNENAIGFSLNFDPALLSFTDAALGVGAPAGAVIIANTNDVGLGRLGLAVGLPAGAVFPAATQQLVQVTFAVAPVLNPVTTPITLGDNPTARQVSDIQAHILPSVFTGGNVVVASVDFEGDVASRPNGDKSVTIIDWVQMGRFVASLDTVAAGEFQRADCAPRSTRGNGAITVTDWVQAGRYAAGLDPLTPVGGPTTEGGGLAPVLAGKSAAASLAGSSTLLVNSQTCPLGTTSTVVVSLAGQGSENAVGFSLSFDAATLTFVEAAAGAGASNVLMNVNTDQVGAGRVGVALALPAGKSFGAGVKELVTLRFVAATTGATTIAFGDMPVHREVSDARAESLPATYVDGSMTVTPPGPVGPPLGLSRSGSSLVVFWPMAGSEGFNLESCTTLPGTNWTTVGVTPIPFGDQKIVPLTIPGGSGKNFFRLKKP